jgi:ABC-type Na+ efflux pump permease subunit
VTTSPPIIQPVLPAPKQPLSKTLRVPITILAFIVVVAIGYGIGASTSATAQSKLTKVRHQLTTARDQLGATKAKLSTAENNLTTARSAAANAAQIAAQKYAADKAKLAGQEKTLTKDERAVKVLEGQITSSSISADGVYVVGKDIKTGTWHTIGGNQCYYATLNSTNTDDISDNNNFNGPETVNVDGAYALQISGGCTWLRTGP